MRFLRHFERSIKATARLLLVPVSSAFTGRIIDFYNAPGMRDDLAQREIMTPEWIASEVARYERQWQVRGFGPYIALHKQALRIVGGGGLRFLEGDGGETELFVAVAEDFRRQNYACEIMHEALREGFMDQGLQDISVLIAPENMRGRGLAKKIGLDPDSMETAEVGGLTFLRHDLTRSDYMNVLTWPAIAPLDLSLANEAKIAFGLAQLRRAARRGGPAPEPEA